MLTEKGVRYRRKRS